MATKTKAKKTVAKKVVEEKVMMGEEMEEGKLDPQEEKILDWILKAVVAFVLGWLGLAIVMVVGGFFKLWG